MTHTSLPRSPRALAAPLTSLAAVLALTATPAFAQDTLPQVAPQTAAAPAPNVPAPVILSAPPAADPAQPAPASAPAPATPTSTANPVVQPIPPNDAPEAMQQAPAPAKATPSPTRRAMREAPATVPMARAAKAGPASTRAADTTARSSSLAQGAVPAAPADAAASLPSAPPPAPRPAPSTVPAPAPAQASSNSAGDYTLPLAGAIGLIAAFGIAAAGIAGMRRSRRRSIEAEAEDAAWDAPLPTTAMPIADAISAPAPVVPTPPPVIRENRASGALTLEPPVLSTPAPSTTRAPLSPVATGRGRTAADVLAASPLPTDAEERHELLERMVAAEPGEDNPFHAHKARLRRARVQLQHHEHLAEEAAARGERFDFRSYKPSGNRGTVDVAEPARARVDHLTDA